MGDNEPYAGALEGDTLNAMALKRGLPHVLIEMRQDLVGNETATGTSLCGTAETHPDDALADMGA